jgi:hypothetical protein
MVIGFRFSLNGECVCISRFLFVGFLAAFTVISHIVQFHFHLFYR